MGVTGKLGIEVDIKASGDVFHELFGTNPHHVSNIVPDQIHGCDVHEGEFGQPGSILLWEYTLDEKKSVAKVVAEAMDEDNKMVRFRLIEGSDLLEEYKSMTVTVHVIPKGDIDAVMWVIDFEKIHDIGLYPTNLMDFIIKMTRDVEAHHVNA